MSRELFAADRVGAFANALLSGRQRLTVLAGMTPQLPTTSLAALVSAAVTREVELTVWVADLTGRFEFLDARGRQALMTGQIRVGMYAGSAPRDLASRVERLPGTLYDADRAVANGALAADVCLIRAAGSPDAVDLGSAVCLTRTALDAGIPLAVELSALNTTVTGSAGPPIEDASFVWIDPAPITMAPPARPANAEQHVIAERVARLVPAGATVQVGIGAIAEAIVQRLNPATGIRFHSGTLPASVRRFAESPSGGHHVATSFAPDAGGAPWPKTVALLPVSTTHSPETLGALPSLWAINSAFTVSLDGDADAEWIGGVRAVCGGGQLDFSRAAASSPGGGSVIALASRTRNGASRIISTLGGEYAATTPGALVDAVVTEQGLAILRGLGPEERAAALVEVAHPDDRATLLDAIRTSR